MKNHNVNGRNIRNDRSFPTEGGRLAKVLVAEASAPLLRRLPTAREASLRKGFAGIKA